MGAVDDVGESIFLQRTKPEELPKQILIKLEILTLKYFEVNFSKDKFVSLIKNVYRYYSVYYAHFYSTFNRYISTIILSNNEIINKAHSSIHLATYNFNCTPL